MESTLIVLVSIIFIVSIFILIQVIRTKQNPDLQALINKVNDLQSNLNNIVTNLKVDFRISREESSSLLKDNRLELSSSLKDFVNEQKNKFNDLTNEQKELTTKTVELLDKISVKLEEKISSLTIKIEENNTLNRESLSKSIKDFVLEQRDKFNDLRQEQNEIKEKTIEHLEKITEKVEEKLNSINEQAKNDNSEMRESLAKSFKEFGNLFDKNVASFNEILKEKFEGLEVKQIDLIKSTETKLEVIRSTVEEKLEKTLSERLGQSFKTVGEQLLQVHKGLGEMQTLAQDVGGLKKVLSNVKMRGGFGEIQLSMLLEQILAPVQYQANVKTKASSSDLVEFAIKLPGRDEDNVGSFVWLPIDAKFPKDIYEQLQSAYDDGDVLKIEQAQKLLEFTIKNMAKGICEKYIDPPNTTDFGIMFLPFEGIYAEVVRKASLLEELQSKYKIIVTGPTTLAAILNSLQMGFRTLAIQKRSSEVWEVLGAVKTEFEKFSGLMSKAHNNIKTGLNQMDEVMGTRTRAIQRKLVNVEAIAEEKTNLILPEILNNELFGVEEES